MAEKTLQELYDELLAHSQGLNASVGKLQADLDAALQREADANGARQMALEALVKSHEEEMASLLAEYRKRLQAAADDAETAKAQARAQVQQFQLAHAAVKEILNESQASRELRQKHADEAAELALTHEIERNALAVKLG